MPHRQVSVFTTAVNSEHMVVLRLQWALWKCLGPRVALDGERFNRLVTNLAQELYDTGVRFPAPLTVPIVARSIEDDIFTLVRRHPGDFALRRSVLSARVALVSANLASVGYRKIVGLAGVLGIIALLPLLPC